MYKSTALECPPPAVTLVRRHPPAPHTQQPTSPTPQTRKHYSIDDNRQPKQQPRNKQRKTAITCVTPREDGHVPNRCRGKTPARHTELSSRPCARCTVVQVHSIGISTTCSDPHETATSCTANTTNNKPHASNTHHPRTTTPTQTLRHTTQRLQLPVFGVPPAKMATFPTDVAARFQRATLS